MGRLFKKQTPFFASNFKTMKQTILCLTAMLILGIAPAFAQKIKLQSGNFKTLEGVKELNIEYDYSDMTITTKNIKEAKFIAEKTADYNDKEAGKGDNWAKSWVADRDKRYAVQFKEEFEKQSKIDLKESGAKYTLIFHTTHSETGYNIGISRRNAYIDGVATIVEAANPSNVIARISIDDCAGRVFGGFDFDTGLRLQEAYAVAGKQLGKFLKKKM